MRSKILTYLCFVVMLFAYVSVFAKKKAPIEPPLPKTNPAPPGLPITGGLSYLFLVGAAYGIYAIRKKFTNDDL